ncbi:hypothetical protein QBC42DRAFT_215822 [Cladorrhinum samala]|uniref:tRNA (uracil-O(2)-)-methyltransferase n=1 Tax=Cladorrhinum samala TaxID=585594 RepID=A0AAV9I5R2_9PEZI|nr:hypothetical protein QBC42DRAFT_215822 [Cladorrhinum samala]
MVFAPTKAAADAAPLIYENNEETTWRPIFTHDCTFEPKIFDSVVHNLIRNPNINSSWLFRADILHDGPEAPSSSPVPSFAGFKLRQCIVRRLIPRNTMRDKPMEQTCLIYESTVHRENENEQGGDEEPAAAAAAADVQRTLLVYLPRVDSPDEMPYYHPKVRGVAFLHEWSASKSAGAVSLSYLFYDDEADRSVEKLTRTALNLLQVVHKHGQGRVRGYQKRVHHDVVIPQARLQDTYTRLKQAHARTLIRGWAEVTDPDKHVFEDLCIAAFLIELWRDMYAGEGRQPFPGFVDIGCGNGLLVWILNREGFEGWGFDARARKSWANYNIKGEEEEEEEDSLRELVLLPPPVSRAGLADISAAGGDFGEDKIHDGRFPRGTFIISNHADELTPWTPILAAISDCPFIAIPCCSHDLTGAKFRAPVPKDKTKAVSTYASLVVWVSQIAADCGWQVEEEMMRIPSTRNTAIIARKRKPDFGGDVDIQAIVDKYGGTAGYLDAVIKLVKPSSSSSSNSTSKQDHSEPIA